MLMHNEQNQAQRLQKPRKHLLCQLRRVLTLVTGVGTMSDGTWCYIHLLPSASPAGCLEQCLGVVRRDSIGVGCGVF